MWMCSAHRMTCSRMSESTARRLKRQARSGCSHDGNIAPDDKVYLSSYLLGFLAGEYARRGWVMQLHVGAERYTSSRLRSIAGPAGGYATIGQCCDIRSLVDFLDSCDSNGRLPKTIIYTLNPADNAAFATLTGSFSEEMPRNGFLAIERNDSD